MPEVCVPLVTDVLPPARVVGSRADKPLSIKGVEIWPIPAAHDRLEDAEGGHRFQGYIVRLGGVTVCHTGDTVMYDGLIERLRARQVDVLLAPINGLDYFRTKRDIIGNLGVREAADLAAAAGVKLLIPAHWDLFAGNAENPGHLFEYLARVHPIIFRNYASNINRLRLVFYNLSCSTNLQYLCQVSPAVLYHHHRSIIQAEWLNESELDVLCLLLCGSV